jgi:hypothetical protein
VSTKQEGTFIGQIPKLDVVMDIKSGSFGALALAATDFPAAANLNDCTNFTWTPVNGWNYSYIRSPGWQYIKRAGAGSTTQLRVYLRFGTNQDGNADYLKFYSGDALAADRPTLTVRYTLP